MKQTYFGLFLFASVCVLSGCTPILWAVNNPNDRAGHQEIVEAYTDEIQSAFEYKNASLSTQSSSGGQPVWGCRQKA